MKFNFVVFRDQLNNKIGKIDKNKQKNTDVDSYCCTN